MGNGLAIRRPPSPCGFATFFAVWFIAVAGIAAGDRPAFAQLPEAGCSALVARVEETAAGSPALSSDVSAANWQSNARCLMGYLAQLEVGTPLNPSSVNRIRVAASALRAIIELNQNDFRTVLSSASTYSSSRALALAASSQEKILRLNSTFVLANIIDPNITCVVVDQLLDPELSASESGRNGRANLLGTLRAMANWADPYTRALMREALLTLSGQIANAPNVGVTKGLIDDVTARLNTPIRNALQQSDNCRGFSPRYARRAFDVAATLGDASAGSRSSDATVATAGIGALVELQGKGSAPLTSTAIEAIWPLTRNTLQEINHAARRAITRAFCYQEQNSTRDPAGRFLIICHPTPELCERTRGPNMSGGVQQSACAQVNKNDGFVDLQGGGYDNALYQYFREQVGPPYPSVPQ